MYLLLGFGNKRNVLVFHRWTDKCMVVGLYKDSRPKHSSFSAIELMKFPVPPNLELSFAEASVMSKFALRITVKTDFSLEALKQQSLIRI